MRHLVFIWYVIKRSLEKGKIICVRAYDFANLSKVCRIRRPDRIVLLYHFVPGVDHVFRCACAVLKSKSTGKANIEFLSFIGFG